MGNRGEGSGEGSIGGNIVGTGSVGKRGSDNGGSSKDRNKGGIGEVERKYLKCADKGFYFGG